MEIRIKTADNGALRVSTNAISVFKQHVLNDSYVRNYASFVELLKYRLFGIVREVGQRNRIGELIVTKDDAGRFHVYELVQNVDTHTFKLVEVSFDGNDTLYTKYEEAFDARKRLENDDLAAQASRMQKPLDKHLSSQKPEAKAFPEETEQPKDMYKDIVSTILAVASQMIGNDTLATPEEKQEPVQEDPKKEPLTMKVPSVPTQKTVKNMSLADKIRLEHLQERLAYCQKNVEEIQNAINAKREELDAWVEEANHYVEEAEALIKRNK